MLRTMLLIRSHGPTQLLTSLGASDERVGRERWVKRLPGSIGAADRQPRRIDQPELRQHRGLVPIDVLVSELAVAEMNDDNQRDLDSLSGGCYPGQHPVHLDRMGEAHDHFVDKLFGPDVTCERGHFNTWS